MTDADEMFESFVAPWYGDKWGQPYLLEYGNESIRSNNGYSGSGFDLIPVSTSSIVPAASNCVLRNRYRESAP